MTPAELEEEVRCLRRENVRLRNPVVAWDDIVSRAGLLESRARLGLRPFLFQSAGGQAWLDAFHRRMPEFDLSPIPFQWNRLWNPDADLGLPSGPSVMHVYYPNFGAGTDEATAQARSEATVAHLERYTEGGGRMLWTLFESRTATIDFGEVDVWLRTRIAELAAAVHVTHEATARAAQQLYPIADDKVRVIPHPLLHDVYPDVVTRTNAWCCSVSPTTTSWS